MVVSEITLFNTLKAKLGEQEAQTVVEGIKQAVSEELQTHKDRLVTKDDFHGETRDVRLAIEGLKADMERGFKENLKWTVGTIIACTGIIITLMKLVK